MPRHALRPASATAAAAVLVTALLATALLATACAGQAATSVRSSAPASKVEPESVEPMPGDVSFSFDSDEPAVAPETTGLDEAFVNPGAVIEHEGVLHMFANVFTAWPGLVHVPHLTSDDGERWTLQEAEPVLTSQEVPFGTPGADVSTGFIADNGTWVLIFSTVSSLEPWLLGRATAPAPEGPWTIDPEPILEPGPEGSWDAGGLSWPSAVRTDDGYALYYTAVDVARGDGMIAMATSPDGVTWSKREEPVLVAEEEWEQGRLDRARVTRTADGYVMVYSGSDLTTRGVATSEDGVSWARDGETAAITSDDFPVSGRSWDAALLERDGRLYYWLEIGSGTATQGTNVYLATADLP